MEIVPLNADVAFEGFPGVTKEIVESSRRYFDVLCRHHADAAIIDFRMSEVGAWRQRVTGKPLPLSE